ncbi:MAG: acyl-CoA dehydrogenase family protein, partial [Chloroflexi bacterium]|nr:acyl-CoA dehydrogenase family protein [Chloroflexota bacterium]
MDFGLSDEHQMVQRMVRDFAAKEVLPTIQQQDRLGGMAPSVIPR